MNFSNRKQRFAPSSALSIFFSSNGNSSSNTKDNSNNNKLSNTKDNSSNSNKSRVGKKGNKPLLPRHIETGALDCRVRRT